MTRAMIEIPLTKDLAREVETFLHREGFKVGRVPGKTKDEILADILSDALADALASYPFTDLADSVLGDEYTLDSYLSSGELIRIRKR